MKKAKLITSLLLLIALCLPFVQSSVALAASDSTTLEQDRQELLDKQQDYADAVADRDAAKEQLEAITASLSKVERDKAAIEIDIVFIDSQIASLDSLVAAYEPIVQSLKEELDTLAEKQTEYLEKYEELVRYSFMQGDVSALEILFESKSLGDFLTRLDFTANILEYTSSLLDTINNNTEAVDESRRAYDDAIVALSNLKQEQVDLRAEQTAKLEQLEVLEAEYKRQEEEQSNYISFMQSELKDIMADIAKIEETIKEKEYSLGNWVRPLPSKWKRISSPYGWRVVFGEDDFHEGIDFPCDTGTEVYAVDSGTVVMSEYRGGYGWLVVIYHGGGIKTYYAHNSKLLVKVGQEVERGECISLSGNTGKSTGPHLHFGVMVDGVFVDPEEKDENGGFKYLNTSSFTDRAR